MITGSIELLRDVSLRRFAALLALIFVYRVHPGLARDDDVDIGVIELTAAHLAPQIAVGRTIPQADFDMFLLRRIGPVMCRNAEHADPDHYVLNLCLCYGSMHETEVATRRVDSAIREVPGADACDREDLVAVALRTTPSGKILPPTDCVFRTGGEQRLSDFELYETSHNGAKLLSTKAPWPQIGFFDLLSLGMREPRIVPEPSTAEIAVAQFVAHKRRIELLELSGVIKEENSG